MRRRGEDGNVRWVVVVEDCMKRAQEAGLLVQQWDNQNQNQNQNRIHQEIDVFVISIDVASHSESFKIALKQGKFAKMYIILRL